jgi:hypothetical protein
MIGTIRSVAGNRGTIIEVAADKTGLILPKHDSVGAGRETPNDVLTKGANGSFIQGISFRSLGGTDPTKHGVHVRTGGIVLSHVEVKFFPGDGFHIVAATVGNDADFGNANHWFLEHCTAISNQLSGLYLRGSDTNAGTSINFNALTNGRWGIWDEAFLSNTHIGAHAQGNGNAIAGENLAAGVMSAVVHNGSRWSVLPGQEVAASTTEPGTDDSVWVVAVAGGQAVNVPFPAWLSGNTYIVGGAYHLDGNKLGMGLYAENDNWSLVQNNATLLNGTNAYVHSIGGGVRMRGNEVLNGDARYFNADAATDMTELRLMPFDQTSSYMSLVFDGGPNSGVGLIWDNTKKMIRGFGTSASGSWPFEVLTAQSTTTAGRSVNPGQGQIIFPRGIFMGVNASARYLGTGQAAPTSGAFARGDTILHQAPSVQTDTDGIDWVVLGWKCTATGTPGTWVPLWTRVSNPPGLV